MSEDEIIEPLPLIDPAPFDLFTEDVCRQIIAAIALPRRMLHPHSELRPRLVVDNTRRLS